MASATTHVVGFLFRKNQMDNIEEKDGFSLKYVVLVVLISVFIMELLQGGKINEILIRTYYDISIFVLVGIFLSNIK